MAKSMTKAQKTALETEMLSHLSQHVDSASASTSTEEARLARQQRNEENWAAVQKAGGMATTTRSQVEMLPLPEFVNAADFASRHLKPSELLELSKIGVSHVSFRDCPKRVDTRVIGPSHKHGNGKTDCVALWPTNSAKPIVITIAEWYRLMTPPEGTDFSAHFLMQPISWEAREVMKADGSKERQPVMRLNGAGLGTTLCAHLAGTDIHGVSFDFGESLRLFMSVGDSDFLCDVFCSPTRVNDAVKALGRLPESKLEAEWFRAYGMILRARSGNPEYRESGLTAAVHQVARINGYSTTDALLKFFDSPDGLEVYKIYRGVKKQMYAATQSAEPSRSAAEVVPQDDQVPEF